MRPAVTTAEVVALGLAAHAGAGGVLPPPELLLALVVAVAAASFALHLRLLNLGVAASLTITAQLALHAAAPSPTALHAGHLHPTSAAGGDDMVLAHAVSALVTVLALVRQEQAAHALVRALVPLLPAGPRPPACPARPSAVNRSPLLLLRVVDLAPHRGPPRAAAASTLS